MSPAPTFHLEASVGPDRANRSWDVMRLQISLRLITNPVGAAYYDGSLDGRYTDPLGAAFVAYASDQDIPYEGFVDNGSRFLHRIRDDVAQVDLPQPRRPSFVFDGKQLCWIGDGQTLKCWQGVSGVPGFQKKEHQSEPFKGPLPEGRWVVRQSRHQRISEVPFWNRLFGDNAYLTIEWFGWYGGRWPGGEAVWGSDRIWLEAEAGTNVYGRSDFSIHGGIAPGSAGCIDLTSSMSDFTKWFLKYGADLVLLVKCEE